MIAMYWLTDVGSTLVSMGWLFLIAALLLGLYGFVAGSREEERRKELIEELR